MPTGTKGTGTDLLIHLVGDNDVPTATVMTEKWTIQDLQEELGKSTVVYLWNKNLQNLPYRIRGGLFWLPLLEIIGYIVEAEGC